MNQQKIEFQRYRDFGQVISGTFEFLRQNFGPLLKSIIFIAGPFILLAGIFGGIYQKNVFSFNVVKTLSDISFPFLLYILFIFLSMVFMMAILYEYIKIYLKPNSEGAIQIDEVWIAVRSKIIRYILFSIGYFLIVFIAAMLVVIPLFFLFNVAANPFAIFLIFLIVVFPIIYLSVVMSIGFTAAMFEDNGLFASINRAFYLIKKRWWMTFGLVFVLGLIQGFMGFIFQIPQYIAMMVIMFNTIDGNQADGITEIIMIATSIIASFSFVFYSVNLVGIALHYFSLVEQKDAKGLLDKIESI
jgi:hypothetical protein